jgi:hypothetical protein
MQEKCEEFANRILRRVPLDSDHDILRDMCDEVSIRSACFCDRQVRTQVSTEYVQYAALCTSFVAKSVLASRELQEAVYDFLFTPAWERGESDYIAILCATIRDYCGSATPKELCLVLKVDIAGTFKYGSSVSSSANSCVSAFRSAPVCI